MRRTTLAFAAALLPVILVAGGSPFLACSSNDANDTADAADVKDIDVCPTAYDASNGSYPHSALPTGQACAPSTSCHIPIADCPTDSIGDSPAEYECSCTSGVWACVVAIPGVEECSDGALASVDAQVDAPADDASADAFADAPADSQIDSPPDSAADAPIDAASDADAAAVDATAD